MRLLARRGVLVFSIEGRGAAGRGREWERVIYRRLGEVELEDQMVGIDHLRRLPYVDPDRIGVFGWSYGGTMVLHLLLRRPGTFRVGASVAPVTDWRRYDSIYTERYMMRPGENPEGYRETALVPLASRLEDPLLLVHGLSDDNVHFDNSAEMIRALVAAGRRFDLMVYPGESHPIAGVAARRHVFATVTSYLLGHLLRE
jgi:dipeptidyl-peptidase-4